jgi:TP901 family phage tail tape measure protein
MPLPAVGLEAAIAGLRSFEAGAKTILDAYDGIEKKAKGVEKSTGGLSSALSSLGSPLSAVAGQFVGLGDSLLKVGTIAGGAALTGVLALGAGITTFAISGVGQAKDLDQQMANIAATMGVTKDAVGPLKQEILDLSLNPNLTVNVTQAAEAIQLLGQNGLTTSQILGGAAESTIAMANATGADFGTAANIATGAMQNFNLQASDLEQVADGITGVLVASKFDANDYALALANAGEIANSTGVSLSDFNAIIASTASSFSSGSDAGTSLKTLLQRFANPTDESKQAMADLGISVFDSSGKMREMGDIVGDLNKALAGMSDEQRANTAAVIGGSDASRTLLALSGMTEQQFRDLSVSVNRSGQASKAAATRVDTLSGAWEILQGIIQAIQIQVGDLFLPILRQVTSTLAGLATGNSTAIVAFFDSLIQKGQELFTAFQKFGAGGLLASLGLEGGALLFKKVSELMTLIMGDSATLANTLTNTLGAAISFLSTNLLPALTVGVQFVIDHFTEIKGALLGVGAVLAGGVFAAIVAGIVSLVSPIMLVVAGAALLGAAWAGNWGDIQGKTFAAWAVIQPILSQLTTWLMTNIPIALQFLADTWTNILLPAMTVIWDFVSGTMFPLWMQLQDFLVSVVGFAVDNLSSQWTNVLLPALSAVWGFISTSILPLLASVGNLITTVVNKAIQAMAGLWQKVLLPALNEVWKFIQEKVIPIFTSAGENLTGNEGLGPILKDMAENVLPIFKKAMDGVKNAIKEATAFFNALADAVSDFTLPDILTPGSPTPLETALLGIANAAGQAGSALSTMTISQGTIDSLLHLNRNIASNENIVSQATRGLARFFEFRGLETGKREMATQQLSGVFAGNQTEILGSANPEETFRRLAREAGILGQNVFSGEAGSIVQGGFGQFLEQFANATARLKKAQQKAFIQAASTALTIGNQLNNIVGASVDILDTRVSTLQELVKSGEATVNFEGSVLTQAQAQEKLNVALQEQRDIQDDILQLQQNQQKLNFLQQQLDLVKTLSDAGLNVKDILGGITLGLDASIPDMVEATNRLVQAMIEQVNKDLQIASPSKVMMGKGELAGSGLGRGILRSIPDVMRATGKLISQVPAMVQAPVLGSGGQGGSISNYNFDMTVNSGATPQGVINQYAIMQAMVG